MVSTITLLLLLYHGQNITYCYIIVYYKVYVSYYSCTCIWWQLSHSEHGYINNKYNYKYNHLHGKLSTAGKFKG
jgi:hypothetical protein